MNEKEPLSYMVGALSHEDICLIFAYHAQTERLMRHDEKLKKIISR